MKIDSNKKGLKGVLDIEQYCIDNNIDAERVTELYCYRNELTELKGLDKLINLKWLDCSDNQLSELDVGNLVNLKVLDCSDNQLSELDVGNLVNLKVLDCDDNQLSELHLSNLVNLEVLYCSSNELTELDVGNLVNLERLYCENNKLTELDVGNLVNLERLDCHNNELTELDLSKLVNLKWLNYSNNKLTKLDVSKLVNLEELNGKEYKLPEPKPVILDNKMIPMEIVLNKKGLKGVFDIEQYCLDNNIAAKRVISLRCHYNEITEIKGLDKLVNLQWLNDKEYKQPEVKPVILDNKR